MFRTSFLVSFILAFMACCTASSVACAHQPESNKKRTAEEILRELDWRISYAVRFQPDDTAQKRLQKERCIEQLIALGTIQELMALEKWNSERLSETLKIPTALSKNLLELIDDPKDRIRCYEMRVRALKHLEDFVEKRVLVGSDPGQKLNIIKAARMDAEIDLLKFTTEIEDQEAGPLNPLNRVELFIIDATKPDPSDTLLRKLQKERRRERAIALERFRALMEIGKWTSSDLVEALNQPASLLENLLEVMDKREDRLKCYEMRVNYLKIVEKFIDKRVCDFQEPPQSLNLAKSARIDAEIELHRFKTRMEKPTEMPKK